jgi:hypothetical protein
MIALRAVLLCLMLLQAPPQTAKPSIDNARVTVWDVSGPMAAQPLDSVVVSLSGTATFVPKGVTPNIAERSIVISLKNDPVAPIANTSGYPLAFPRPGAKKLLENAEVIVWDYLGTLGVPTPMHFHDKDAVLVYLDDGQLKSVSVDGKVTTSFFTFAEVTFNPRDRTHTETLLRGKQHAIITELK